MKQLNYRCYNLYSNSDKHDETLFNRNKQILNHYGNADINMFQQHINGTFPKIGTLNKYDF